MSMLEFEVLRAWVVQRLAQLRTEDPDRGSNTAETVIWTAVIVVAALAIGAVIVAKITEKATNINLQ